MKNFILFALTALFITIGCNKDNSPAETANLTEEQLLKNHSNLMDLKIAMINEVTKNLPAMGPIEDSQTQPVDDRSTCNRVVICHNGHYNTINKNAVPAHLAHGDQLTCCETSCINQSPELISGGPFSWYYDYSASNCLGWEATVISYSSGFIAAEAHTHHGTTHYFVYSHDYNSHGYPCFSVVAEQQYLCARNYLRSYIAANSCIPNLCSFF